jgi:DNA-binding NarL/FixJ family response regulator
MPIEIKKKISRTLRGKKKSPEHCAAISKGRREKVKPKDSKILRWLPEIQAWIDSGLSYRAIAKILGVSHSTVSRLLTTTPT